MANSKAPEHEAGQSSTPTGTVSRALQLLSLMADTQGSIAVKQVAESMGLAPSTAHRLLQLLRKEGFVDGDGHGRYAIGTEFYRVAARVHANGSPDDLALPFIQALADDLNETVLFGRYLPVQKALSFTARADGVQRLKYEIDMHAPLSLVWGASGKGILAFLPAETALDIIQSASPSPVTGAAVPEPAELDRELSKIRRRGFAVTDGEKLPNARGIAAPVYGPRGVVGCICLTSPKARMPQAETAQIGARIMAAAAELSKVLGAA